MASGRRTVDDRETFQRKETLSSRTPCRHQNPEACPPHPHRRGGDGMGRAHRQLHHSASRRGRKGSWRASGGISLHARSTGVRRPPRARRPTPCRTKARLKNARCFQAVHPGRGSGDSLRSAPGGPPPPGAPREGVRGFPPICPRVGHPRPVHPREGSGDSLRSAPGWATPARCTPGGGPGIPSDATAEEVPAYGGSYLAHILREYFPDTQTTPLPEQAPIEGREMLPPGGALPPGAPLGGGPGIASGLPPGGPPPQGAPPGGGPGVPSTIPTEGFLGSLSGPPPAPPGAQTTPLPAQGPIAESALLPPGGLGPPPAGSQEGDFANFYASVRSRGTQVTEAIAQLRNAPRPAVADAIGGGEGAGATLVDDVRKVAASFAQWAIDNQRPIPENIESVVSMFLDWIQLGGDDGPTTTTPLPASTPLV